MNCARIRKKTETKKAKPFHLLLSPEDHERLRTLAFRGRVSAAEVIRTLIRKAPIEQQYK
jgi:hypothetical protein